MIKTVGYILFVTLFWGLSVAHADIISGRVVGVHDGDTLTILDEANTQTKVRLAEIDTPESKQPYGSRAKQELSGLVFDKTVAVAVQDIDRYGRTVGRVTVDGQDVNAEMVRRGAAWVYRQYAKDPILFEIEAEAQANKVGLWALPEADRMPPWEWRKAGKNTAASAAPKITPVKQMCCKVCSKGKPCGDSCISRSRTCHKTAGCAC